MTHPGINRTDSNPVMWMGLLAALLLIALIFILTWARDRNQASPPQEEVAATPSPSQPASPPRQITLPPGAITGPVPGVVVPGDDPVDAVYGNADSVRRLMVMYKKANRYSPTTLRLTADMIDVLMPNQFHPVTPHFVRARELESGEPDPEEERLYHRFWTDQFATSGSEAVTLRFSAWQGVDPRKPVSVLIHGLEVFGVTAGGDRSMGKLRFSETSPTNFDAGQHQVVFTPQNLTKVMDHGYLRCVLHFQFPGEEAVRAEVVLHHTHAVPARFTGDFGEQVVDGDLNILAGIEVLQAGSFNLSMLLFDEHGRQPVAYVNQVKVLEEGVQRVDFTFHGLVFHDARIPGPYQVTALRGYLQDDRGSGRGAQIPEWTGGWRTGPHPLSDFTNQEYTSPTKEATLEAYRRQLEELERQPPAPGR